MLNRPVARELQTELEPELLRAVPLNLCMSGWAKHFVPPDPGMFKVDHSNYDLSRQTEYYDEFLSHDWETSRWYKFVPSFSKLVWQPHLVLVSQNRHKP